MRHLLTALALALAATLPSPTHAEDPSAESAAPSLDLEVVTFNIRYLNRNEKGKNHWRERKALVIAAMSEFKADVFGLQEALRPQLDDLATALPGYTEFGIGRDDGKRRGEYSPILFRSDRFKLDKDDCGTFWLSDTPNKIGSMSWGEAFGND